MHERRKELLVNIAEDYAYIQNVKISHEKLIQQASNSQWRLEKVMSYPDGSGICEYGALHDRRHQGLKVLIFLENMEDHRLIAVGRSCYKKLIGQTQTKTAPSVKVWEESNIQVQEVELKMQKLFVKLRAFAQEELPYFAQKAEEYHIECDTEQIRNELEKEECLGLAIARLRDLDYEIMLYERKQKERLYAAQRAFIQQKMTLSKKLEQKPKEFHEQHPLVSEVAQNIIVEAKRKAEERARAARKRGRLRKTFQKKGGAKAYVKQQLRKKITYVSILKDLQDGGVSDWQAQQILNSVLKKKNKNYRKNHKVKHDTMV